MQAPHEEEEFLLCAKSSYFKMPTISLQALFEKTRQEAHIVNAGGRFPKIQLSFADFDQLCKDAEVEASK